MVGLSSAKRGSVLVSRKTGLLQYRPPSLDLLTTMPRMSMSSTEKKGLLLTYTSPFGAMETHGSPAAKAGPPVHWAPLGITTCRHRLPPSKVTAPIMVIPSGAQCTGGPAFA